jgi:hypothetical protein
MKECLDVGQPQVNKGMNKLDRDRERNGGFCETKDEEERQTSMRKCLSC